MPTIVRNEHQMGPVAIGDSVNYANDDEQPKFGKVADEKSIGDGLIVLTIHPISRLH